MNSKRQSDNAEKAHSVQPNQPLTLAHTLLARANWGRLVLSPWLQRRFKPGAGPETGLEAVLKRGFIPALTTIQTKVLTGGRPQHPVHQTPVRWPTRGILNPGRLDRFTNIIANRFPMTRGKYERHQLEFRQADSFPLILAGLGTEEESARPEQSEEESFESMLAKAESFESMLAKTSQIRPTVEASSQAGSPPATPGPKPAQIQRTSSRFETMLSRVKQGSARSSRPDISPSIASQAPKAEAGPGRDDQPPRAAISKRAFSRVEELLSPDQASLVPEAKSNTPVTHKLEPPSVEESPPVGPMAAKPAIEPESSPGIAPAVQRQPEPEGPPQKSFDSAEASPVKGSREGEAMSEVEPNHVVESPKQQQVQPETIRPEPTAQSSQTKEVSFEENGVKESLGDLEPSQIATPKVQRRSPSEMSRRELPAPTLAADEPPTEETSIAELVPELEARRPPEPEISLREAPGPPSPTEEQAAMGTTIAESVPKPTIQRGTEPGMPLDAQPASSSTTVPATVVASSSQPPAEVEPILGEEAEPPHSQAFEVQRHVPADQKKEMPLRLQPTQETESGPEETQSLEPDEVVLEPGKGILAKVTSRWRLPPITSSRFTQGNLTEGRSPVQMTVLAQTHIARADETETVAETPALAARLPLPVPRQMKGGIPDGQKSDRDSLAAQPAPSPVQHQPAQPMAAQPVTAAPPQESSRVIQRANGIAGQPVFQPAIEESVPDLDNLARQVYPLIKRMLAVEQQRRSSR